MSRFRRNPDEEEVQQYIRKAQAGLAGQNPKDQTLARSSNPYLREQGQRNMAEREASNLRNHQDAQREQERAQKERLEAQEKANKDAAESAVKAQEDARKMEVRQHAAQGGATVSDVQTGKRSIATHPDGARKFEPAAIGDPVAVATQVKTVEQDGKRYPLPDTAPGIPVMKQPVRNDRGEPTMVDVETKTDKKTGNITVPVTNPQTGLKQDKLVGYDADAAYRAKRESDIETKAKQTDYEKTLVAGQRLSLDAQLKPAANELDAVEKEMKALGDAVVPLGNGFVRVDKDGNKKIVDAAAHENDKRLRAELNARLENAKKAAAPLQAQDAVVKQREQEIALRKQEIAEEKAELEAGLPQGYRHLLQEQAKQKADYDRAVSENEQRTNSLTPQAQPSEEAPSTPQSQPVEQTTPELMGPPKPIDLIEKRGLGALAELPLRKVQIGNEVRYQKDDGTYQSVAVARKDKGEDVLFLSGKNVFSANDWDAVRAVAQNAGSMPVYYQPTPQRKTTTEEQLWVRTVVSELQDDQRKKAEGANPLTVSAQVARMDELGISPKRIREQVYSGEVSINTGAKLLKDFYGQELEHTDPEVKFAQEKREGEARATVAGILGDRVTRSDGAMATIKQGLTEIGRMAYAGDSPQEVTDKAYGYLIDAGYDKVEARRILKDTKAEYGWTSKDTDRTTQLSTGQIRINPARVFGADQEIVESEIAKFNATPEEKKQAARQLRQLRESMARVTDEKLSAADVSGVVATADRVVTLDMQKSWLKFRDARSETMELPEILDEWTKEQGNRNGFLKLVDVYSSAFKQARLGIMGTVTNTAAGLAGTVGAGDSAAWLAQGGQYMAGASEDIGEAAKQRGLTGGLGVTQELLNTAGQVAPMLVGGAIAGGMKGLAAIVTRGAAMEGYAFMQGFGGKINDSIALRKQALGRDLTEAEMKSVVTDSNTLLAAYMNGAQTVILQKLNPKGAEAFVNGGNAALSLSVADFLKKGGRQALRDGVLKNELKLMARNIWGNGADDFVEEWLDQFIDEAISGVFLGKEIKLGEALEQSFKDAAMGFGIGATLPQLRFSSVQAPMFGRGVDDAKVQAYNQNLADGVNATLPQGATPITAETASLAISMLNPGVTAALDKVAKQATAPTGITRAEEQANQAQAAELVKPLQAEVEGAIAAAQDIIANSPEADRPLLIAMAKAANGNMGTLSNSEVQALQNAKTADGKPVFVRVRGENGQWMAQATPAGRAEIEREYPLLTAYLPETFFQPSSNNEQNNQGQPTGQAGTQAPVPVQSVPVGTAQTANNPPTGSTGANAGIPASTDAPQAKAPNVAMAQLDAAMYEALRAEDPTMASPKALVQAARAAGKPVSPSMAALADSMPDAPDTTPVPATKSGTTKLRNPAQVKASMALLDNPESFSRAWTQDEIEDINSELGDQSPFKQAGSVKIVEEQTAKGAIIDDSIVSASGITMPPSYQKLGRKWMPKNAAPIRGSYTLDEFSQAQAMAQRIQEKASKALAGIDIVIYEGLDVAPSGGLLMSDGKIWIMVADIAAELTNFGQKNAGKYENILLSMLVTHEAGHIAQREAAREEMASQGIDGEVDAYMLQKYEAIYESYEQMPSLLEQGKQVYDNGKPVENAGESMFDQLPNWKKAVETERALLELIVSEQSKGKLMVSELLRAKELGLEFFANLAKVLQKMSQWLKEFIANTQDTDAAQAAKDSLNNVVNAYQNLVAGSVASKPNKPASAPAESTANLGQEASQNTPQVAENQSKDDGLRIVPNGQKASIVDGNETLWTGDADKAEAKLQDIRNATTSPMRVANEAVSAAFQQFPILAGKKMPTERDHALDAVLDTIANLSPDQRVAAAQTAAFEAVSAIAEAETTRLEEQDARDAEASAAKQAEKAKKKPRQFKGFRKKSRLIEIFEADPFIISLLDAGGVRSAAAAARDLGAKQFKANRSMWEGAQNLIRNPQFHSIWARSDFAQNPDQTAQALYDENKIQSPTPDALWERIARAMAEAKRTAAAERTADDRESQDEDFAREKNSGPYAIDLEKLQENDVVQIDGEEMTVVKIVRSNDGGIIRVDLQDGSRFGLQTVPGSDEVLFVESYDDGNPGMSQEESEAQEAYEEFLAELENVPIEQVIAEIAVEFEQVIAEIAVEFGQNADLPAKLRIIAPGVKRMPAEQRQALNAAIGAEAERLRVGVVSAVEWQRMNPFALTVMEAFMQRFLDSHSEKTIQAGMAQLLTPKAQNALMSSPSQPAQNDVDSPAAIELSLQPYERPAKRYDSASDREKADYYAIDAIERHAKSRGANTVSFFTLGASEAGGSIETTGRIGSERELYRANVASFVNAYEQVFAKKVVFYKTNIKADGGVIYPATPNVIGIDANSSMSLPFLLGHELGHAIKRQDRNLYDAFQRDVLALAKGKAGYGEMIKSRGYTDDKIDDEMFNDVIGNLFARDTQLWQELAAKDSTGAFTKIASLAAQIIEKIISGIRRLNQRDTTVLIEGELIAVRKNIAEMLKLYRERGNSTRDVVYPENATPDASPVFLRGNALFSSPSGGGFLNFGTSGDMGAKNQLGFNFDAVEKMVTGPRAKAKENALEQMQKAPDKGKEILAKRVAKLEGLQDLDLFAQSAVKSFEAKPSVFLPDSPANRANVATTVQKDGWERAYQQNELANEKLVAEYLDAIQSLPDSAMKLHYDGIMLKEPLETRVQRILALEKEYPAIVEQSQDLQSDRVKKKRAESAKKVATTTTYQPQKSTELAPVSPASKSTTAQDAAYLAAVEAGDMETAQRMVDDAAKAAGYLPHASFRDMHTSPSNGNASDDDVKNDGADASLAQVRRGVHNQPDDFFHPVLGPRYYSYEDKAGMESLRAITGKGKTMTVYRAVPTSIVGKKMENRDWVSPSKTYAVQHGESRFGEGEYRIIKESILATDLFWDGNDIREWGKDDDQNRYYKNTPNNIKSADAVTRDESGEIIPLSQRFNPLSDSILYSSPTSPTDFSRQETFDEADSFYRVFGKYETVAATELATWEQNALRNAERAATRGGVRYVRPVIPENDTRFSASRYLSALTNLFRKRIAFVVQDLNAPQLPFDGMVHPQDLNTIIIDAESRAGLSYLIGHEVGHGIQHQRPELYDKLKVEILFLAKDWSDYNERLAKVKDYDTQEKRDAEFVNDFIGSQFGEPEFWRKLQSANKNAFQQLLDYALEFLGKLGGRISNLHRDVRPYFDNIDAARARLVETLESYQRGDMPAQSVRKDNLGSIDDALLAAPLDTLQGEIFTAAMSPDAAKNLGDVRVGGMHALRAYRTLMAKKAKVKLSGKEEQQLLDEETALGQKMAFDMEDLRTNPQVSGVFAPRVGNAPPPQAQQMEMSRYGESDRSGQMMLLSSPTSFKKIAAIARNLPSPPNQYEYTASTETRPEVIALLKEFGYQGYNPPANIAREAARLEQISGISVAFVKGPPILQLAGNDTRHPRVIFVGTEYPFASVGYAITHEIVHAAQKDSRVNSRQALQEIAKRITENEFAAMRSILAGYGYPEDMATTASEMQAFLVADAVMGTNYIGLENLSRKEELRPLLVDFFESLPKLSPDNGAMELFSTGTQGSALMSSPTPPANRISEMLAKTPPIFRTVYADITSGMTPAEVATKNGIQLKGVENIMRRLEAYLGVVSAAAAGNLNPVMRGEKILGGRPDLSYGSTPHMAAIDQIRNNAGVPDVQSRESVIAEAERRLAENYEGEYENLLNAARDVRSLTVFETAISKLITANEMLKGNNATQEDLLKLGMLGFGWREIGAEQARSFAMRFDPFNTPAERHASVIAEALTTPDADTRARMRKNPKQAEKILESWLTRVGAIERQLLSQGIDIKAALAEHQQQKLEQKEAAQQQAQADAVIQTEIKKLSKGERAVIEAIRSGSTVKGAAQLTGYTPDEVAEINTRFVANIKQAMRDAAKAYLDAVLRISPSRDSLDDILAEFGIFRTEEIDDRQAGFVDRRNEKRKERRKRKPKAKPATPATAPQPTPPQTPAATPKLKTKPSAPSAPITGRDEMQATWVDGEFRAQEEIFKQPIDERTGTFDLNDPLSVKAVLDAFALARGTKADALMEFWRMSILTGPQTAVVNVTSGTANAVWELVPKRFVEATFNTMLKSVGMGSDEKATFGEFVPMVQNLKKGIALGARNAIRSWQLESRTLEAYATATPIQLDFTGVGTEYIPPAVGGKLGKIMRSLSFRHMTAADEFIKSVVVQVDAAAQAYRIAKSEKLTGKAYETRMAELMQLGSKAWVRAVDTGKKVTFQEDLDGSNPRLINRIDQVAEFVKRGRNLDYIGKPITFLLPFIDTPTNIFKQAVLMSPLGTFISVVDGMRALRRRIFSKSISKEEAQARASELYDKARFVEDITNQTLGWAVYFALEALLTGDDDELPLITGSSSHKATSKGERDNEQSVMPAQTIRIFGMQFSYGRFDPFATILASSVDFITARKRHGWTGAAVKEWAVKSKAMLDNKTFLQGLSNLMNAYSDPERFFERVIANTIAGFVPNIIRQPLREADTVVRDTSTASDKGFLESIATSVGYSVIPQLAPEAIDIFGETIPRDRGEITGNDGVDMALRIFDPTNLQVNPDIKPTATWIYKWNQRTADSKDRVAIEPIDDRMEITMPGENKSRKVTLTAEEKAEANRNIGKNALMLIGGHDAWKKAPLTIENAEMIKDAYKQARETERARLKQIKMIEILEKK